MGKRPAGGAESQAAARGGSGFRSGPSGPDKHANRQRESRPVGLTAPRAQVHHAQGRDGERDGQQGGGENECASVLPTRFCTLLQCC